MALDGIFLSKVKDEIYNYGVGTRVDRVNQPSKDEIVLNLRGKGCNYKLLICVRADSPRVHFTSHSISNPPVPPMFCMLMRKYLTGALLKDVRQHEMDRIIFLDFDATNEIGDKILLTVCVEIMGKHSNMILIKDGRVIDALKRVDFTTSSVRQILPGIEYKLPLQQGKLNIESDDIQSIVNKIASCPDKKLSSAVIDTVQGVSPVISREISYIVTGDDSPVYSLNECDFDTLGAVFTRIKNKLHNELTVYMLKDHNGKPKDLAHMSVGQYEGFLQQQEYASPSELLDDFYFERDRINRINHRGQELIKLVNNLIERTVRKLSLQRQELKNCANKEQLKLYGELIVANLYRLEKGVSFYEVENYYDECKIIRIPCNPALSPGENQKKYYKDYRKAQTAEKYLERLIDHGEQEIVYLESVAEELSRAESDTEISLIREELALSGYIRNTKGKKQKAPKELPPMEFMSDDGFRILVGRNNIQNDKLSLKTANKHDMWLHTQKTPGSHVIICSDNKEISDLSIEQAANIAACYSKAKDSSLVPVDYTFVKQLKKPNGAKAGMVIYHEYWTLIVNPDKELTERLKIK